MHFTINTERPIYLDIHIEMLHFLMKECHPLQNIFTYTIGITNDVYRIVDTHMFKITKT